MKARLVSAVVLAAAVALSTAGCGFITPQATNYEYAPSDGVNVTIGDVDVRNALFITNDDATKFNLSMTAVSAEKSAQDLKITLVIDGERSSKQLAIKPGLTKYGNKQDGQELIVFTDLDLKAGQTVLAYFEVPGIEPAEQYIPVLDGSMKEYEPLVVN